MCVCVNVCKTTRLGKRGIELSLSRTKAGTRGQRELCGPQVLRMRSAEREDGSTYGGPLDRKPSSDVQTHKDTNIPSLETYPMTSDLLFELLLPDKMHFLLR